MRTFPFIDIFDVFKEITCWKIPETAWEDPMVMKTNSAVVSDFRDRKILAVAGLEAFAVMLKDVWKKVKGSCAKAAFTD